MAKVRLEELKMKLVESISEIADFNNDPNKMALIKKAYFELKDKADPDVFSNLSKEDAELVRKAEATLSLGVAAEFKSKTFVFTKKYMMEMTDAGKKNLTRDNLLKEIEEIYIRYLKDKVDFLNENKELTDFSDMQLFESSTIDILSRKEDLTKTMIFEA